MGVGRLAFSCPTPSFDGRYWSRYPNGNAPSPLGANATIVAALAGDLNPHLAGGASAVVSAGGALQKAYATSFPGTENPISESGAWTNGGIFSAGAASKTNVQTAGKAYGTMFAFDGSNYIDSCACLSGFGPNHEVTCTVANAGAIADLETEILLRASISSTHVQLYELDCVFGLKGIHLVRWDMTTGTPNAFVELRAGLSNEAPFNNGDQVYASIVGTLVTVKYKLASGGGFSTLFTYDTGSDSIKYAVGNPGVGFWNQTGSATNSPKFAWADFLANTLP